MSTISIDAKQLTVRKNKTVILNGLSFAVESGRITGLIGPSGSGKTTLMRSIVGVQKISDGHLQVLDMASGAKQLRTKIGYVTQQPAIYGDLTVQQNLRYFGALVRAKKADIDNVIKTVDLTEQSRQLARTLSGGQQARVSLAIALLGKPQLLVLDEPTVGLDPILRRDLWQLFRRLANEGKTLLVSSHVMDEAEQCDDILLLRSGELLWNNTKDKLLQVTKSSSVEHAFLRIIAYKERT